MFERIFFSLLLLLLLNALHQVLQSIVFDYLLSHPVQHLLLCRTAIIYAMVSSLVVWQIWLFYINFIELVVLWCHRLSTWLSFHFAQPKCIQDVIEEIIRELVGYVIVAHVYSHQVRAGRQHLSQLEQMRLVKVHPRYIQMDQ